MIKPIGASVVVSRAAPQDATELVATLEAPMVTLAAGVLFAPVMGALDSRRAQALTSRLLQAVSEQRAHLVVLDIAGIATVDTAMAKALIEAAQAVRLLGCGIVISGIAAATATTLTHLNISLGNIKTARSPQEALERYQHQVAQGTARNGRAISNYGASQRAQPAAIVYSEEQKY